MSTTANAIETAMPPALTPALRANLKQDSIQTRVDNELYLRNHPEVKEILNYLLSEILIARPENVQDFATDLLADPKLKAKIIKS